MKGAVLLIAMASVATAQVPLRGVAYDSLHARPLSGAFIGIVGLNVSAVSDSLGRFTFPSVPPGTYRLVMQHDALDAIGLSAAGARAVVTDGKASIVVAVPSFATLWRAACGRQPPVGDSGFVFGTVVHANQPVPRATVAATWLDLYVDSAKTVRQKQKLMEVDADSSGDFALCGVPTTTGLSLRASATNRFGQWMDVAPLDKERIARRDLRVISLDDSAAKATSIAGRAEADTTGLPLADVEVQVTDLGLVATTDAQGAFRISGVPPGTHALRARKIGYAEMESTVGAALGQTANVVLKMSRVTTLDSVNVVARYSPNDEAMRLFEEHRKLGLGKFFTREDLEKQRDRPMADILAQLPGIKPEVGNGGQGWLLSTRGDRSISIRGGSCSPPMKQDHPESIVISKPGRPGPPPPCTNYCYPHVFLDGADISPTEIPNINRFNPDELEAIEYFAGAAQVPLEYNRLNKSYCGVIVLHTRRGKL